MKEGEVISDKAEKDWALNTIKTKQSGNVVSDESTIGVAIEGFPMLPIGNQILLEYNQTFEKGGIKLSEPMIKTKYPKVIGHGAMVKNVRLGDRVVFKEASVRLSILDIEGHKFHSVYDSAIMGIFIGEEKEETPKTIEPVKPTIIV